MEAEGEEGEEAEAVMMRGRRRGSIWAFGHFASALSSLSIRLPIFLVGFSEHLAHDRNGVHDIGLDSSLVEFRALFFNSNSTCLVRTFRGWHSPATPF